MSEVLDAKLRVKNVAKRVLARMGYFLGRYPQTYTLQAHLLQLVTRLRINCILDVGAHYGEFLQQLRESGYTGRVVSFEPIEESFAVLRQRHGLDPKWRGFPIALGDRDGDATLNLLQDSLFTSFLTPNSYGEDRFAGRMHLVRTRTVATRTLDSMWSECMDGIAEPRVLLKLDTQGYDLVVLRGAAGHIDQIDALQLELAVRPIYQSVSNELPAALCTLRDLGFLLAGLYPVSWDPKDHLSALEIDGLFWRHRDSG